MTALLGKRSVTDRADWRVSLSGVRKHIALLLTVNVMPSRLVMPGQDVRVRAECLCCGHWATLGTVPL